MTQPNTPPSTEPDPSLAPDTTTDGTASDSRDPTTETAYKNEIAKYRRVAKETQTELEKLRTASASEAEKAVIAARAEGAAEYAGKWRTVVLQNAALSALAERGIDAPGLAVRALDLDDVDIDDNGKVDKTALTAAIDALIVQWPQLAPRGAPPLPTVTGDTQPRVTADQVIRKDASDADIEAMLRHAMRTKN